MTDEIPELREAVDRLRDADEALRTFLRERPESEMVGAVTKPKQYGGSGVGRITIKLGDPGRPCYFSVLPSGTLFVSKQHPNTHGRQVPAEEADGDLLRRAVEFYPVFVAELVERVNDEATRFEGSLPDDPAPEMELRE